MRYGAICAVVLLVVLSATFGDARTGRMQNDPRSATASVARAGYSGTTNGLRDLLDDMEAAARNGDSTRLRILVASTEIPDYTNWFVKTFGAADGARRAAAYGRTRGRREAELQNEMVQFAQRPGYFSVREIVPMDMYEMLETPLDLFLANWSPPDVDGLKRRRTAIGYFFYIRGKFCWNSGATFEGGR